jgi:hypothetical protein
LTGTKDGHEHQDQDKDEDEDVDEDQGAGGSQPSEAGTPSKGGGALTSGLPPELQGMDLDGFLNTIEY